MKSLMIEGSPVEISEWKALPKDRWPKIRKELSRYLWATALTTLFFALMGLIIDRTFHLNNMLWSVMTILATLGVQVAFFLVARAHPPYREWKEEVDDELAQSVWIKVIQDDLVTGEDAGVLSILDDTIIFIGQRCEFAIGCQHLRQPSINYRHDRLLVGDPLFLTHPDRDVRIEYSLNMTGKFAIGHRPRLVDYLNDFVNNQQTPSSANPVYPPLSVHPSIKPSNKAKERIYAAIFTLVVAAFLGLSFGFWILPLSFVALMLILVPTVQALNRKPIQSEVLERVAKEQASLPEAQPDLFIPVTEEASNLNRA